MPDRYEHGFMGAELMYKYNTLYITDFEDNMLLLSDNPFALVMLAAKQALLAGKVPEMELVYQKLLIATSLYERRLFSKSKVEGILTFLNNYVLFEDPETNRIFEEQLDKITGKISTMGIIEQLAEIKAEEARIDEREKTRQADARKFVENLLSNTEFSLEKIASLTDVPIAFVEKVKESLRSK